MLFLAAVLAGAVASAPATPAPQPVPVDTADDSRVAALVLHRQPALPIVALRMSVLADDPPGYAGAGHLIQHLVFGSLQEQARQVGARVEMSRTSDALVYTITGPASELEYLAAVLRSALRPRVPGGVGLLTARYALSEERLAEWETAGPHVRAALRTQLFPNDLSAAGTESSIDRLDAESLDDAWAGMYRPERVSVVAVGDVRMAELRRAFSDLPPAPAGQPDRFAVDTVFAAPLAPAEATRGWLGLGYSAADAEPAALLVTSELLREVLRERLPTASVETEHWWTHHGQALVAVIAAPEADLGAARRAIGTALSALEEELGETAVRDAANRLRRDMLFYARTPEHMAEAVGRFTDRGSDPEASQRFYDALGAVGPEEVRSVLQLLEERTPVRIEIPPQKLKRS